MNAIIQYTLKKLHQGTVHLLLALGFLFCVLSDTATSMNEQVEAGSLLGFALGSQSLQIPPVSSGTFCTILFTMLIGVFLASSDVAEDMNSGMLFVLLSKPLSRTRYILGKFLGLLLFSWRIYLVFEIGLLVSHLLLGTGPERYTFDVFLRQLLPAAMIPVQLAITMNFAILAGSMGAMVFSIVYFLFSAFVSFLPLTARLLPEGTIPGLGALAGALHYLFPNLFYFIQDSVFCPFLALVLVLYMLSLTIVFILIMNLTISRIDLHI